MAVGGLVKANACPYDGKEIWYGCINMWYMTKGTNWHVWRGWSTQPFQKGCWCTHYSSSISYPCLNYLWEVRTTWGVVKVNGSWSATLLVLFRKSSVREIGTCGLVTLKRSCDLWLESVRHFLLFFTFKEYTISFWQWIPPYLFQSLYFLSFSWAYHLVSMVFYHWAEN